MTQQTLSTQAGAERKNRWTVLKFFVIVFPLWLSAKFFTGPYMEFIRGYFAAVILIILLALLFQLLYPKMLAKTLLMVLFLVLTLLEVTHYFLPGLYASLSFSIGEVTLVGGTFSINMIPYYGVGGFIGYFILQACKVKKK